MYIYIYIYIYTLCGGVGCLLPLGGALVPVDRTGGAPRCPSSARATRAARHASDRIAVL